MLNMKTKAVIVASLSVLSVAFLFIDIDTLSREVMAFLSLEAILGIIGIMLKDAVSNKATLASILAALHIVIYTGENSLFSRYAKLVQIMPVLASTSRVFTKAQKNIEDGNFSAKPLQPINPPQRLIKPYHPIISQKMLPKRANTSNPASSQAKLQASVLVHPISLRPAPSNLMHSHPAPPSALNAYHVAPRPVTVRSADLSSNPMMSNAAKVRDVPPNPPNSANLHAAINSLPMVAKPAPPVQPAGTSPTPPNTRNPSPIIDDSSAAQPKKESHQKEPGVEVLSPEHAPTKTERKLIHLPKNPDSATPYAIPHPMVAKTLGIRIVCPNGKVLTPVRIDSAKLSPGSLLSEPQIVRTRPNPPGPQIMPPHSSLVR
ncbi:hypothetical protein NEMIN01_0525 [Nematocida minor]|uniref:uncharacterized protein n=1 Tax=Nematocida minor TaxID=1912983 RepID=UPI002220200E|nr:uncharacterized protein NEMIN01_0525 [Nematocida minor]KAI5189462.1 hypothetical protein NEMIN01_0525 [Nematocida minor]